jgi:chromosomal replication initiator protein
VEEVVEIGPLAGRMGGGLLPHPQPADDRWSRFRNVLQGRVSPGAWQTWLGRLEGHIDDDGLTLVAPSDFHLRWVVEKHGDAVEEAFSTAFGTHLELRFTSGEPLTEELGGGVPALPGLSSESDSIPALPTPEDAARLVRKYRFESFVVGQSNRFAWAAAMAVTEQPGNHYNPLFIYGGAGLGKTHLLNAIGHHALELYPGLTVRYISSEAFFNDFIDCIRRKRMDEFKHRYRTTDILLLDDVQFFEGKEQILEEFFHTFNTLYESGKQMVISSDRHPRNLASLEDRLRSRFEWGLLTDIQPPDVETRLAILKRNADFAPIAVPADVLEFIAGLVSDNIRELEGALTRVTAYASLTGEPIDVHIAERVLQDLLPGHEAKAVNAPDIIRASAEAYGYSVDEVAGPSRRQPLVQCRQVAMYLCRELTDLSLPKIGAMFGGRDHTTVMYAIEKVQKLMQSDREVFDRVSDLSQSLRRTS